MKFSIKYHVLGIKGFLLVFCFIFLSIILSPYYIIPVFAADSTPSADVKSKLEALNLEIASKAAKLKQ